MSTTAFDYQVRNREGRLIAGQLQADGVPTVAQRLREMGYTPVGIARARRLSLKTEIHIPWLADRVRLKDVAMMSRQLATMVSSGLTLVRALSVLADQIESAPLRAAVVDVRKNVEAGSALSIALALYPRIFDKTYVAMVQAAEASGQIDDVLARLASTIERRVSLRAKVRSAMTYPLVMVAVVIVVVTAMMIFVVPTFAHLYGQFHSRLPLPTRIVVEFSHVLASVWMLLLVAVIVAAAIVLRRWEQTEAGRRAIDVAKLRLPIFGPLAHKVALERLASMLGSLLTTGVGILESLDLAADNAGNVVVAEAVRSAQGAVREGRSLGSAMSESAVIPTMFTQMVETGEESSAVGEMLEKVATFYGNEVESTVNSLTSLLEPLIVVVMGIVIGAIVVSLYLPMFKYITLVGNSQ